MIKTGGWFADILKKKILTIFCVTRMLIRDLFAVVNLHVKNSELAKRSTGVQ